MKLLHSVPHPFVEAFCVVACVWPSNIAPIRTNSCNSYCRAISSCCMPGTLQNWGLCDGKVVPTLVTSFLLIPYAARSRTNQWQAQQCNHSRYSETCIRRSPLGADQLAVIQRWPAYIEFVPKLITLLNGETVQVAIMCI